VLERYALRRAAAVVTVCTSLTQGVKARAPEALVFQIEDPPLVDPKRPPPDEAVAKLRQSLGLDARPVILYSGNFEPYQGVPLLVQAAAQVPEAQFLFMGGEASEIETMRAGARELGTGDRCFFSGKRSPSELPVFLALAALVASPRSKGENTPFKIYTYLASGKPLIATRIPTHTQLLDDSLAFLVEPTAGGLAGGIRQALANPAEAAARASRSLALIERAYSPARHRDKVEQAYDTIARLLR